MKKLFLIFAFLSFPAFAQNGRWDLQATTVQAQGGNLLPVYAIPGAAVSFLSCSSGLVTSCTTPATTYNGAGAACPSDSQVNPQGSLSCTSTADTSGNFGAFFANGTYAYTLTANGSSYGPFLFSVGSGSSCGDCVVTDPTASQAIVQPTGTLFDISSPEIGLISQDPTAAATGVILVEPSHVGISGNSSTSAFAGDVAIASSNTSSGSAGGNISVLATGTAGDNNGSVSIAAITGGGTQSGDINLSGVSTAGGVSSGNITLLASAPTLTPSLPISSADLPTQGIIILQGRNGIGFGSQNNFYSFAGPVSGITAESFLDTLDFSHITADHYMTVPDTSGELGVIAGTPTGGNCAKFDSSGKWIIDAGTTCGGGGGSGITGLTTGQVGIAGSATTLTSSIPINGAGAGLVSGPTSATPGDVAVFTGTAGQVTDGALAGSNIATLSGAQTFTGAKTFGALTATTSITDSALTAGQCVQAGTGGLLTVTGSACGSGGGSGTVTHTTGALTSDAVIIGNGGADIATSGCTYAAATGDGSLTCPNVIINAGASAASDGIIFKMSSSNADQTVNEIINTSSSIAYSFGVIGSNSVQRGFFVNDDTTNAINWVWNSLDATHPRNITGSLGVIGYSSTTDPSTSAIDTGFSRDSAGVVDLGNGTQGDKSGSLNLTNLNVTGSVKGASYLTQTTCTSTASPAACGSSITGIVQVAAAATTLTINSTAITANTGCWFTYDTEGITAPANITSLIAPYISARTAGTSISITLPVAPLTNAVNIRFGCLN